MREGDGRRREILAGAGERRNRGEVVGRVNKEEDRRMRSKGSRSKVNWGV